MFGPVDPRRGQPAPKGAIKTKNELLDLVIEARKTKKAIRIWTVTQSGYLSCFYLYSKSRIQKYSSTFRSSDSFKVNCIHDHAIIGMKKTNDRWFKTDEYLGSYNIQSDGGNCHYAFTNKMMAYAYSKELKTDKAYMKYVKDWHSYCNKKFSLIGW